MNRAVSTSKQQLGRLPKVSSAKQNSLCLTATVQPLDFTWRRRTIMRKGTLPRQSNSIIWRWHWHNGTIKSILAWRALDCLRAEFTFAESSNDTSCVLRVANMGRKMATFTSIYWESHWLLFDYHAMGLMGHLSKVVELTAEAKRCWRPEEWRLSMSS
jgi:hypothetical protein